MKRSTLFSLAFLFVITAFGAASTRATCTVTVDTNADSGPGSLRAAINYANGNPGVDTICFAISGGGVQTITPLTVLPMITQPVIIDGYTQSGASANTLASGDNAVLQIHISGSGITPGPGVNGLLIGAGGGGSAITGLIISGFSSNQILINGSSGNTISGNFIGTDPTGAAPGPAASIISNGINLNGSNNTIGGTAPAARNIISGNPSKGVFISGVNSNQNLIQGNYIGTDVSGTKAVMNGTGGVTITGGANNIIGGTAAGAGNLISGNGTNVGGPGIFLYGNTGDNSRTCSAGAPSLVTGTLIQGNLIGTDVTGQTAIGNSTGVYIACTATGNVVGGTTVAARNVISGNRVNAGFFGQGVIIGLGASQNSIQGNYIGTDISGTNAIPNESFGVSIGFGAPNSGASNNTIGGPTAQARNVISGNASNGVAMFRASTGNVVQSNFIGTNVTATAGLGNGGNGVQISGGSFGNLIGGTANNQIGGPTAGNLIAANAQNGVGVFSGAGNTIVQNSIFSNGLLGIELFPPNGVTANDPCDADTGANNLQNHPDLTSLSITGGVATITGNLNSTPGRQFYVEFFANASGDALGYGEGKSFIGSAIVTTDGGCNGGFNAQLTVPVGQNVITATATDVADGSTSEFSAWFATTSTSLVSNNNPSVFGQSVTFTATVSSSAGTPGGTVTFRDGADVLGTGTLNGSGQATFSMSGLVGGTHSITATYNGSTNLSPSSSANLTQTVNPAITSTTVASSQNPSTFGQSVTFTATVSSTAGTPSGTVTFRDGPTILGTGTLDGSGQTMFSTSGLSGGTHSITATYEGNSNFGNSFSSVLTQTVNPASTSTSITSDNNPSTYGQPVTFTATVSSTAGTPGGTMTFKDGSSVLCTSAVDATGHATCTTSTMGSGSHSITATYNGDTNFSGSSSSSLMQTVNQASTSTSLSSSANPSAEGQSVTFTAHVATSVGAGTPSGTVTFSDGTTVLATVTVDGSGNAAYTTTALSNGYHSITATYNGDANHTGSGSLAVVQLVYGVAAGGGSFVIGDGNATVGSSVTYWGAQWASQNTLSGGSAPSSFKGFADESTGGCGGNWATRPGNSSNPPAAVPAYMAVIVTGSASKSGSTISGNTTQVVIVRTNPGYDANPGHPGTGTVVAVICH